MRARKILLPGNAPLCRRADERVPDEQVQAFAQRLVERGFQVVPQRFLPVRPDGGEPFRQHEVVPVRVRGAGGLLDEETVFVADAMRPRPCPELAHRRVVPAEAALRVNRHGVRPAAFGMNQQAVLVRAVLEQLVMIVNRQVAHRLPKVVQETVALVAAVDDFPRNDWQPVQQIVAAPFLKFLAQGRRPVCHSHLPTVRGEILQSLACVRPGVGNKRFDDGVPIFFERARVERIKRVAVPAFTASGDSAMVVERAAEAENLPLARRGFPMQRAVGGEVGGQVEHIGGERVLLAGGGGKFLEQRRGNRRRERFKRTQQGFLRKILNRLAIGWQICFDATGHYEKIAVKIVARCGLHKLDNEIGSAGHAKFCPRQFFRSVVGSDHRAAEIPAALDVEAHFQTEPAGFVKRVLEQRPPFRR